MNIVVVGRNPEGSYSGGRYHAWILAEAIAKNHKLIYFSNAKPIFANDFVTYKDHKNVDLRIIDDQFYDLRCEEDIDIVFFIPGMDADNTFYKNTIKFASKKKAHLVLINFESPNWFNKYSVIQRNESLWDNWVMMSRYSSCILSSSKEGMKYAKLFYKNIPQSSVFEFCYPSINSQVADQVYFDDEIKKEKRIIMTARFTLSDHKGSYNIPDLFCEEMRGHSFILILGSGDVPSDIKSEIENKAQEFGINVEYKRTLDDKNKFIEIKRAKLVLFPSFFEGFGYPPIEAQYLNTACVAFRIPVIEETSPRIDMVKLGDWSKFKREIAVALEREEQDYHSDISEIASFDSMVGNIDRVIRKVSTLPLPKELNDTSSIKVAPRHVVETSTALKEKCKNILGEKQYVLLRNEYQKFKSGDLDLLSFLFKVFKAILKTLLPENAYRKLTKIYHKIKG
ncbi:glycosyltransferase [Vibrio sp. SCSIO 43137]|uniref:glycosyltransferase n=1 Tax=Vibrio sp. SCSIO 43137 TaxID=3021011 RepID=UPI00230768B2|nr:glycosyltransferase [Vibrio sp. SCSIO 43137]WCE29878.1 glycosyltransferase [Vibrio sp. SCSIO 43137]